MLDQPSYLTWVEASSQAWHWLNQTSALSQRTNLILFRKIVKNTATAMADRFVGFVVVGGRLVGQGRALLYLYIVARILLTSL